MRLDKYSPWTLKVTIGDIEIYTAPDMGFVGSFSVTPRIHSHPYYEIIAVIDGRLRIGMLDNEDIVLKKGSLCVIPPKCYHSTSKVVEFPKMLAIRFSYGKVSGEGKIYEVFCKALENVTEPCCFETPDNFMSALLDLRYELPRKADRSQTSSSGSAFGADRDEC